MGCCSEFLSHMTQPQGTPARGFEMLSILCHYRPHWDSLFGCSSCGSPITFPYLDGWDTYHAWHVWHVWGPGHHTQKPFFWVSHRQKASIGTYGIELLYGTAALIQGWPDTQYDSQQNNSVSTTALGFSCGREGDIPLGAWWPTAHILLLCGEFPAPSSSNTTLLSNWPPARVA